MGRLAQAIGSGLFLTGALLLSAVSVEARNVAFQPWKGEPPPPETGARILAIYRIGGQDMPVWSRMPRRPYRVLGVLRSFETVGLSHRPFYRLAQEARRRGGDAIAVLAPRDLPGGWIRGDDPGVTIHGERFTVLVLRSESGLLLPNPPRAVAEGCGIITRAACRTT